MTRASLDEVEQEEKADVGHTRVRFDSMASAFQQSLIVARGE